MEFSVKVEGLEKIGQASKQIQTAVAKELDKALYASAEKVVGEAKKSLLDGQKSGRIYKRGTVTHKASAPGEAPASDTGRLANATYAKLSGPCEASAISGNAGVKYAKALEFGTLTIAPRPYMIPALEKSKAWIAERLNKAVRKAAADSTKT